MDSDPEARRRGLAMMAAVYGWSEVGDGPGDFFSYTVEHLLARSGSGRACRFVTAGCY